MIHGGCPGAPSPLGRLQGTKLKDTLLSRCADGHASWTSRHDRCLECLKQHASAFVLGSIIAWCWEFSEAWTQSSCSWQSAWMLGTWINLDQWPVLSGVAWHSPHKLGEKNILKKLGIIVKFCWGWPRFALHAFMEFTELYSFCS